MNDFKGISEVILFTEAFEDCEVNKDDEFSEVTEVIDITEVTEVKEMKEVNEVFEVFSGCSCQ